MTNPDTTIDNADAWQADDEPDLERERALERSVDAEAELQAMEYEWSDGWRD